MTLSDRKIDKVFTGSLDDGVHIDIETGQQPPDSLDVYKKGDEPRLSYELTHEEESDREKGDMRLLNL